MKKLLVPFCLTLIIFIGSVGVSESADMQKGNAAHDKGDYATALREWTPLAKQGNASAQYNLGYMYANGKGVPQDYIRAHMWYNFAASSGHKNATKNRDIVAKNMTPADISTAQKLARECVRKKYKGC